MITCPRCNHQNLDTAAICDLCGANLAEPEDFSEPTLALDVETLRKGAEQLTAQNENDDNRANTGKTAGTEVDGLEAHSGDLNDNSVAVEDAAALEEMELAQAGAAFFDISSPNNDEPPTLAVVSGADEENSQRPSLRLPGITSTVNKAKQSPGASGSGLPKARSGESDEPGGLAKLLQAALDNPSIDTPAPPPSLHKERDPTSNNQLPGIAAEIDDAQPKANTDNITDGDLSNFLMDALDQSDDPMPGSANLSGSADKGTSRSMPAIPNHMAPGDAELKVNCPHCDGSNPQGIFYCIHCGGGLKELPTAKTSDIEGNDPLFCPSCGHENDIDNRFCGSCGFNFIEEGVPSGNTLNSGGGMSSSATDIRVASQWDIKLISINEDGSDGVEIPLNYVKTVIGRSGDTRFPTDAFLSPKHASLNIEHGELFIEDMYSLNGTFVKIRDEVELSAGDLFLMGRQVLRFEKFEQNITPKARASDGTRYMGSPPPGGHYKLLQIGIGGIIQNVYCIPESGVVLGREKGEIIFPRDKFMSGRHAQLYLREDDRYCLVDLNSSNGTWIKIWEKTRLHDADFIFLGQQLFRVEIDIDESEPEE